MSNENHCEYMDPVLFSEDLKTALRAYREHRSLFGRVSGLMNEYAGALTRYAPEAYAKWFGSKGAATDFPCTEAGGELYLAYVSLEELTARIQGELGNRLLKLFRQDSGYQVKVLGKAITVPEAFPEDNLRAALASMPPEALDSLDNGALVRHLEDFFAGKVAVPPCMTDMEVDCHCEKCESAFCFSDLPSDDEPAYYDVNAPEDLYALISRRAYFAACARSLRRRLRTVHEELSNAAHAINGLMNPRDGKDARVGDLYEQGIEAVEDARGQLSVAADDALDELRDLVEVLLRSDEARDAILEGCYDIPDGMLKMAAVRISLFCDAKDPPGPEDIMPAFLEYAKLVLTGMLQD